MAQKQGKNAGFQVVHFHDLLPVQCPCGTTRCAFADTPYAPAASTEPSAT